MVESEVISAILYVELSLEEDLSNLGRAQKDMRNRDPG